MTAFIDIHREKFGVEAICHILGATECGFITSRGCRVTKTRPTSARDLRDATLLTEFTKIHQEKYGVYGVRKMWHAKRRAGWDVGQDQVARLMRLARLHGVPRGSKPVTTCPSGEPGHHPDLVERKFAAESPHQLWVADITYVHLPTGFCYTAFITDVCTRRIVGWAVASSLHTESLPLLALEQALISTGAHRARDGLIHHSDRGVQYFSLAYSDALTTAGVKASVGTARGSYDNALADAVDGLYKTELIYSRRVWGSVSDVEIATMAWAHWWSTRRIHEVLGYRTPAEVEATYTHPAATAPATV